MTPPGIDPGTVRLVAQRLNHYATPGPSVTLYLSIILILFYSKWVVFRQKFEFSSQEVTLVSCNCVAIYSVYPLEKKNLICTGRYLLVHVQRWRSRFGVIAVNLPYIPVVVFSEYEVIAQY